MLLRLCASGVPADAEARAAAAAAAGLRTLALARRRGLAPADAARGAAALEARLEFAGLALLDNPLKPDAAAAVSSLKRAGVDVLMASGDHVRTAVHVAARCGILDGARRVAVLTTAERDSSCDGGGEVQLECALAVPLAAPPLPGREGAAGAVALPLPEAMRAVEDGSLQCAITGPALRALHRAALLAAVRSPAAAVADAVTSACLDRGGHSISFCTDSAIQLISSKAPVAPTAATVRQPASLGGAEDAGAGESDARAASCASSGSGRSAAVAVVVAGDAGRADAEMAEAGAVRPEWLRVVLSRAAVYARCQPADKALLVELLGPGSRAAPPPEGGLDGSGGGDGASSSGGSDAPPTALPGLGRAVLFCGDGANDTGALRAALVGLSLCQADASVAAPLTSQAPTPAAAVAVVAEGRCSLAAAHAVFGFVVSYALCQVLAVCLLYSRGLTVGNYQYLIQDLLFATLAAAAMSAAPPAAKLAARARRPPARLLSAAVVAPVAANFLVVGAFQVCGAVCRSDSL